MGQSLLWNVKDKFWSNQEKGRNQKDNLQLTFTQ